jgi:hypothetical protein
VSSPTLHLITRSSGKNSGCLGKSIKDCIVIQALMIILHFHLQIIKEGIARTKNVDTKLSSWDLVTQYDRRVEKVLVAKISNKFPSHK